MDYKSELEMPTDVCIKQELNDECGNQETLHKLEETTKKFYVVQDPSDATKYQSQGLEFDVGPSSSVGELLEEVAECLSDDNTKTVQQLGNTGNEQYCEDNDKSSESNLDVPKSKRFKTDNTEPVKTDLEQTIELVNDITKKLETHVEKKSDIFDDFGTYIASVLRKLPRERALAMQPRIIGLINSTET